MDNSSNFMQEVYTLIPFIFFPLWKDKRCTKHPEGKKEINQGTPKSKSSKKKGGETFSKTLRSYEPINFYNEFTEGKGIASAGHLPKPTKLFTHSFSQSLFFSEPGFSLTLYSLTFGEKSCKEIWSATHPELSPYGDPHSDCRRLGSGSSSGLRHCPGPRQPSEVPRLR